MAVHRVRNRLVILLPVALGFLAACPFSPVHHGGGGGGGGQSYLPPTTVTNVLANLKLAYTTKDPVAYGKLFDANNYNYVFAPSDAGHEGIPTTWGLSDELSSAENLFASRPNRDGYRCETIALNFQTGLPGNTPLNPAWTKVTLSDVRLNLDTRHKDTGDPLLYQVAGDQADLYFVQSGPVDPETTQATWRVVRWEDKPVLPGLAQASRRVSIVR